MVLLKVLILQSFWFFIVLYAKAVNPLFLIGTSFIFVCLDYLIYKPKVTPGRYSFLIMLFMLVGFLNDSSLIFFNLVEKNSYHYANLLLWVVFIAYYEQIFTKFKHLNLIWMSLLGSLGGMLSYWAAVKLNAINLTEGGEVKFILSQLFFWGIFFPMSIKLYFTEHYWNSFLDKTIVFSFDQTGFKRHKKNFKEDLNLNNLEGKNVLVTGGTSGIGAEAANFLSRLKANLFITGRNLEKGLDFEKKNINSKFISLDMSNWTEVHEFAEACAPLDYVILNAGSMPEKLIKNKEGVEFQAASQLFGHYYLLLWLKKFKKLNSGARIVWVSSGGMYLKKLDLQSLEKTSDYDKVETYANVKRAQVTLVEELSKINEWNDFYIYSMHPGWVGTEGLKEALPKFYRLMEKRLRTPGEGADTIVWCLLTKDTPVSGGFYFDRKKVSPYITENYRPSANERAELMKILNNKVPNNKLPAGLW